MIGWGKQARGKVLHAFDLALDINQKMRRINRARAMCGKWAFYDDVIKTESAYGRKCKSCKKSMDRDNKRGFMP